VKNEAIAWEAFAPYKQPAYHQEAGLLAKGDVLTDFSAAIKAIAAGRRAAASIHKSLYGISLGLADNVVTPETPVQNVDHVHSVPVRSRQIMPLAEAGQVAQGVEIEKGFSPEEAKAEADRCLQCGLICYLRESQTTMKEAVGDR
jgi:formate dehydrogenase beta subunit